MMLESYIIWNVVRHLKSDRKILS